MAEDNSVGHPSSGTRKKKSYFFEVEKKAISLSWYVPKHISLSLFIQ